MTEDERHLVELYDSLDDPEPRAEFLDSFSLTRCRIDAIRRRRDAKPKTPEALEGIAPEPPESSAPPQRSSRKPRSPRRRVVVTHPPTRSRTVRRRSTPRTSQIVFVVVFEID